METGLSNFAIEPPSEKDNGSFNEPQSPLRNSSTLHQPTLNGEPVPYRKRKQLNVVSKKDSQGKILYMSARPNHLSYALNSIRQIMLPEDIRMVEFELRRALRPKYARDAKKDVKDYLRVAMVGLLPSESSSIKADLGLEGPHA